LVALAVRAPLAGVVMAAVQQDRFTGEPIVAGVSGVAEEAVRFMLLIVVGHGFSSAVWVGLGWGALETLWALLSRGATLALIGRDPESQAVSLLPNEEVSGPLWGVVERLSSTIAHIAFTLLIAASPILVIGTAVAHATRDVLAVRLGWTLRVAQLQAIGLAWAVFLLGAAWLAWTTVAGSGSAAPGR
jgi:hypothetical protein